MNYTAAVITVSDKASRGQREDTSGPALAALLEQENWTILHRDIVPDEKAEIQKQLLYCADELGAALVLTTGGTGFSPRDITPEATKALTERDCPGIPEAMRAASMLITPKGCLSREYAGIRGRTLIVNLPGSKKAATENFAAVIHPLRHGVEMLLGEGSADCGSPAPHDTGTVLAREEDCGDGIPFPVIASQSADWCGNPSPTRRTVPLSSGSTPPSMDAWIREAKAAPEAANCGMYLFHRGVVRGTAKAAVRFGDPAAPVRKMLLRCDREKAETVAEAVRAMDGIYYVRVWLNEGELKLGEDLMLVLVGGDIRPRVTAALETLVNRLKEDCLQETELP